MHELSITESILEISLKHGKTANASKITDIYLVLGQLSSIVDDSIQFYWAMIAKDTIAEGARLHFERVPASIKCRGCGHVYQPEREDLSCPVCQSIQIEVTAGNEFYLDAINVET